MTKTKAVAKKDKADIVVYDYGDDAGSGFEDQTKDFITIPFIAALQKGSPQVEEETPPGAKAGLLYNTVTEELFEDLVFVPAYAEHVFVEWVPRDSGGGFVDMHLPDSDIVREAKERAKKFGEYKVGDNDLIETFYVYGVVLDADGEPGEMITLAFTSTKIKVFKRWNTKVQMFTIPVGDRKQKPPLFAHQVRLSTKKESNPAGTWHNFVLAPAHGKIKESLLKPGSPAMEAAKECRDMLVNGLARAAHDTQKGADKSGVEGDPEFDKF